MFDFQTVSNAINEIEAIASAHPDIDQVAATLERARNLMAVLDERAETVSDDQTPRFAMHAVRLSALITQLRSRLILEAGDEA